MKITKKAWFVSILKEDYRILIGTVIVGIITSALGLAMAIFVQKLIDEILPSRNQQHLMLAIIVALGILVAKVGVNIAQKYMGIVQARDFNTRLIDRYFRLLLQLPKSFFDRHPTGDLIARMNDSASIQGTIAYVVNTLIISVITAIGSGIVLWYYSTISGVLVFVCFLIFFMVSYAYKKKIAAHVLEMMKASADKESNYITTLHNIELIKSQNKQQAFSDVNSYTYGIFQHKTFALGKVSVQIGFVLELVGALFYVAILGYASYSAFTGTISIGALSAILAIVAGLLPVLAVIGLSVVELQGATVAFERMYEMIATDPEFEVTQEASKPQLDTIDHIQLEALQFEYVKGHEVLKGVHMEVKKGEMISIFGENGSGKSTILKLIMGFYAPTSGTISLNKRPIHTYGITSLRTKIAYVSQQTKLFNCSLIENICLDLDPTRTQEAISFLDSIGFGAYVAKIPGGYHAQITENGTNLSGGQKQILSFVRALYQRPEVLLLDEPTAAMDLETEKYVLELMKGYKPHGIIILVTHRLRPSKISDTIYVLDQGVVTQSGDHEHLVAIGDNLYSNSYQTLLV